MKLSDGWRGLVALRAPDGEKLSESGWLQCLSDPSELVNYPVKVLKSDGTNTVVVKELTIAGKVITAVVKVHNSRKGIRSFFRSIRRGKSARNFDIAAKLCGMNIPTAYPLAALEQKRGFLTTMSIYITEYLGDSCHLYDFIKDRLKQFDDHDLQIRKQISYEVAQVLAGLHTRRMWHRDAKAVNFLVKQASKNRYTIYFVDMDGIKPYLFGVSNRQFDALAKLASTLIWSSRINRTDYLRTFVSYCKLTGLDKKEQQIIYRKLVRRTVAVRLLTMANAVIEGRCMMVEGN